MPLLVWYLCVCVRERERERERECARERARASERERDRVGRLLHVEACHLMNLHGNAQHGQRSG